MDALRRVRARYEPERNKGTERVSVFLVLAPIQPDLDLFAAGRIERKRRRGEKRFPWWTVFGCQADVKNAFRNRERFSMLCDYNVLAGLESFLPLLLLLLFWGKMVSSDSLCEFIVDRTGNLRNSIEMRYVTNVAS